MTMSFIFNLKIMGRLYEQRMLNIGLRLSRFQTMKSTGINGNNQEWYE